MARAVGFFILAVLIVHAHGFDDWHSLQKHVEATSQPTMSCDLCIPTTCERESITGTITIKDHDVAYTLYSPKDQPITKSPIIVIHGGPGGSSASQYPMQGLVCEGRQVVLYDQMGCGDSWTPENVEQDAPWLLTIDYYVDELEALIAQLQFSKVHVYGHSWGTVVAQEYAIRQREELVSVILSGPYPAAEPYINGQWEHNFITQPPQTRALIHQLTDAGDFDSPTYQFINQILMFQYTTRQLPIADCAARGKGNHEIYVKMQGASEFTIGGVLGEYDVRPRLHMIQKPLIVVTGQFDTMQGECNSVYVSMVPTCKGWTQLPHSGHMTQLDATAELFDTINPFMEQSEQEAEEEGFLFRTG